MASKSDDYQMVKRGRMKFKGNKSLITSEVDLHGGINICIECSTTPGMYLAAMDNGRFTIGEPHVTGEGPNPEEIFTLIKTPDDELISMKTGFGKYIGVDSEGNLIAMADAVGTRERMIVVFQDGKTAIQSASNNLFLSMKPDIKGYVSVVSRKAQDNEMINLRTDVKKEKHTDWLNEDDKRSAVECETSYIRMFQHSKVATKGKYINIDLNDKESVRRAQEEGNLHELLLERRVKTKSDKYC
ncbi:unnamed protein product [Thelazia callipaeda]|uniref:FRG1-like family protein n=1 Tax=Thelazia callipaeda TaxID=103827 RepID=A0A0N5D6Q5_THECL|nr:unnamed protein product [Thelazia callipaeda]